MITSVRSRILKSEDVDWRSFKFLQNSKFKELSQVEHEKLKNSILLNQFVESFKVWENKGKLFCLDGYHRCKILNEIENEGIEVPDLFRADFVECENEKEAAKLVLVYSSVYAKVTADGMASFADMHDIDLGDISTYVDIPEINFDKILGESDFDQSGGGDDDGGEGIEVNDKKLPGAKVVREGDLWALGDHRIVCGSCIDNKIVSHVMQREKAAICVTSPPYNAGSLDIEGEERTGKKYRNFNDDQSDDEYLQLLTNSLNAAMDASNDVFFNVQLLAGNKVAVLQLLSTFAIYFKDMIYWRKTNPAPHIADGCLNKAVELIPVFNSDNNSSKFSRATFSQGTAQNVIEGPKNMENEYRAIHKAAFPLYLPTKIIEMFSKPGDIVLDIFGGTGTTLIACENTGRKCRLIDIEPLYIETTILRWQKETGKQAIREDGKKFDDLMDKEA